MNFINALAELDKLYESVETDKLEEATDEFVDSEEEVELEIEDDETEEIPVEEPAEEPEEVAAKSIVLECAKCGALVIKAEVEVTADEETGLVNSEEECAYCGETAGFRAIGTFESYGPAEEPAEEVEEVEEPSEEANKTPDVAENAEEATEEELAETEESEEELEEGIFDSKATKEKNYKEDIKNVFGADVAVVANNTVIASIDLISSIADMAGEDDDSTNIAKNVIQMIKNAEASINKTPQGLVKQIASLGQKYNPNEDSLNTLKEFISKVGKLQTASKTGFKAMEYLMEKLNQLLSKKLVATVNHLKREFGIV